MGEKGWGGGEGRDWTICHHASTDKLLKRNVDADTFQYCAVFIIPVLCSIVLFQYNMTRWAKGVGEGERGGNGRFVTNRCYCSLGTPILSAYEWPQIRTSGCMIYFDLLL